MVKRSRRKNTEEKILEGRCYIEELPDEILSDIISRLNTNGAARACTVSRRWRNLWTLSSCMNLDFDFTDDKPDNCNNVINLMYLQPLVDHLRIAFHDHTDDLHPSPGREWFWFVYGFTSVFKFANVKQVRSLYIDIKASTLNPLAYDSIFMRTKVAILTEFNSWDRLTTLSLKSVIMYDRDVDRLLLNSPNLETLLLDNVPITHLELTSTTPKLKRLEILHCAIFKRIHIISAPNLESFKHVPLMNTYYKLSTCFPFNNKKKKFHNADSHRYITKTNISLHFEHAPRLGSIYLGGPLCRRTMMELQMYAPQVQKLQLNMDLNCDHAGCWRSDRTVPTLENLKQLELKFTSTKVRDRDHDKINKVIDIIHSCPIIEKLTLEYEIQKVDTADENYYYDNSGVNEFLQEVEIVGWSGLISEVELVQYLIRTSPKLQRLSLLIPHLPIGRIHRGAGCFLQ